MLVLYNLYYVKIHANLHGYNIVGKLYFLLYLTKDFHLSTFSKLCYLSYISFETACNTIHNCVCSKSQQSHQKDYVKEKLCSKDYIFILNLKNNTPYLAKVSSYRQS